MKEKTNERLRKIVCILCFLVFGIIIGRISVSQNITEQDFNDFKAGYTNGAISQITKLIASCSDNVNVFRGKNLNDEQWGIVYKCNSNNDTIKVRYSGSQRG